MPFNFFQKFSGKKGIAKAPTRKQEAVRHVEKLENIETPKKITSEKETKRSTPKGSSERAAMLIVAPHISEKATMLEQKSGSTTGPSYVFRVNASASKPLLKKAVEDRYDVKVQTIRTINIPARSMRRGRVVGRVSGFKKAIVTLHADNHIDTL